MRQRPGWGRRSELCLMVLLLGVASCEEPQGFARVERHTEVLASFQKANVEGQGRVVYFVSVPQKDHPEFLINWVNLNRQITVELYVFRRSDYDATDNNGTPNSSKPPMQLAEELTEHYKSELAERESLCREQYPGVECPLPKPDVRILWPLLPLEGPMYGDRLPTQLHLHPTPVEWVIVFYNPLLFSPTNRAQISGSIELSYFSLP